LLFSMEAEEVAFQEVHEEASSYPAASFLVKI
jgi:hypothetical protein